MIIRTPPKLTNRNSVVTYVEVDLWSWLKELSIGLLKIDFKQNFQSFTVNNLKIPAAIGSPGVPEVSITNQFRNSYPGNIPSGRIITRQSGDGYVVDGFTKWSDTHVYLRNPTANDVVISVIFFK